MDIKPHCLPKILYQWEEKLGAKWWIKDLKEVTRLLPSPGPESHVKYDLDVAYSAAKRFLQDTKWNEALFKPNLCSYVKFKD